MNEIVSHLASNVYHLTTDELKQAKSIINAQLEILRQRNELTIKAKLRPGLKCKVDHPKAFGKVFIITKVNRTKVKCQLEGSQNWNSQWNIPISMLEIIG